MDDKTIKEYIERLKDIENSITSETTDFTFIKELDNIMNQLNIDVKERLNNDVFLNVKYKKLVKNAVEPQYAKNGDAGLDLTITSIESENEEQIVYNFGISVEIPSGYVGLLFPRSSVRNFGLILSNCVGVIDSGYRGEISATFNKISRSIPMVYNVGERGAQLIIIPFPKIKMIESEDLSETERGVNGHGSSGR